MATTQFRISSWKSYEYRQNELCSDFYRTVYAGGRQFIDRNLTKFSVRESDADFNLRKDNSYSPSFAKAEINNIKNNIYERMCEIKRVGGPKSYQDAMLGLGGGVDQTGKSMNAFMGQMILPELLTQGRVGVFIDKPTKELNTTLSNKLRPYIYPYANEDIWNYNCYFNDDREQIFTALLVNIRVQDIDQESGLVVGFRDVIRQFWLTADRRVAYKDWSQINNPDKPDTATETIVTELTRIPFVMFELTESLLTDIGDYQRALLNLGSSDFSYCFKGNFPFLTEQFDPKSDNPFFRQVPAKTGEGTAAESVAPAQNSATETSVGVSKGRRYSVGTERPEFIGPPVEQLMASIKKQEQLKAEMKELINLNLRNVKSGKTPEITENINSGLAYIGFEMQYGEAQIAKVWSEYEVTKEVATIHYPEKYELKSDSERLELAKELKDLKGAAPSTTYNKEIGKEIAETMFASKVTPDTLEKIKSEIDDAEYITSDCEEIAKDIEMGLVSAVIASNARGYNGKKQVPIAKEEHVSRLEAIAIAQSKGQGAGSPDAISGARGTPASAQDKSAKDEKTKTQDGDVNPDKKKMVRGEGK